MALSLFDHEMLLRCYRIARLGHGNVSPNPCVGALLVLDGNIIGQGHHHQLGGPHAEVECFNSVIPANQGKIQNSTLYVSLEPCSHHGQTPPCAHEVVRNQVKRVVVGLKDPNPQVSGNGIIFMRNSGVQVELAPLTENAIIASQEFLTNHLLNRPHVILKWAQSRDGFIGKENQSTKISCGLSDIIVHKWRSQADAILVGTNTAIQDNPKLTTRLVEGRHAHRVVIDRNGVIPSHHHLFTDGHSTTIFGKKRADVSESHHQFIRIKGENHQAEITHMLDELKQMNFHAIIVEGGSQILRSFISSGLWDEARIITSPFNLEEGLKAPSLIGKLIAKHTVGTDFIKSMRNQIQMEAIKRLLDDQMS